MSRYTITVEGRAFDVEFKSRVGSLLTFVVASNEYQIEVSPASGVAPAAKATRSTPAPRQAASGDLRAPMPGIISEVVATPGMSVKTGDLLAVIEAMKMENPIKAPSDGKVAQVLVKKGQEVGSGAVLMTWEK